MVAIIGGKRYNTETAQRIAQKSHYHNGNPSGVTYVGVTPKGRLFKWRSTNGQDLYLNDSIWEYDAELDGFDIVDEELAKKYKLFEEA